MFEKYPHTDLHELNLDWIIKKVKELSTAWAQVQQDWTDEQAAFANLQNWIENYFNNLDVQTEINVKLDSMVVAGTMSELIAPYVASGLPAEVADQIGDVVAAQIGPVVAAQISAVVADQLPAVAAAAAAQEVSAWLALHVNPDTGYVIDDSFTVQGAAADAKAVGDEFTAIKSALTLYQNYISDGYAPNLIGTTPIIDGYYISYAYGVPVESATYSYTDYIPIEAGANYMCNVPAQFAYYDAAKTYVSGGTNAKLIGTIPSGVSFIRLSLVTANISTYYFNRNVGKALKIKDSVIPQSIGMNDALYMVQGYKPNLAHLLPMIDGEYVDNSGSTKVSENYSHTTFIEVKGSTKYYSNCVAPYCWFASDKTPISGGNTFNGVIESPVNAVYIELSVLTAKKEGLLLIENNFPYVWNGEYFESVLTVGTGKMFTSLRSAFDACTPIDSLHRYKIEFYGDGTAYNIYDDFTAEEKADSSFWGLFVPPFTRLVGMGNKENNIISLVLDNYSVALSALNLYNTSSLENMTIRCTKGRYAVHDDQRSTNNYGAKVNKVIKNCVMIGTDLNNDQAYGAGYVGGEDWLIENCTFITDSTDNYAFAAHNANGQTEKTTIKIVNCRMKTGLESNVATGFGSLNNSTVPNEIFIIGTETNGVKLYENQGQGIKTRISGYANDIKSDDVVIQHSDSYDYSSWVSLI